MNSIPLLESGNTSSVGGSEEASPVPPSHSWHLEGKRQVEPKHIHKLIATSIVSSFTLNNLGVGSNLQLNSMVPTILINHDHFWIALYDCVNDVFLLSEEIELAEMVGRRKVLRRASCLLLWIIVNHR